jgi:hypothetical protein
MDFTVYLIIYGISIFIAFYMGASTREKKVVIPNPIKMVEQKKEIKKIEKEIQKQDEIYKTIADNIDSYNGTAEGQKDIPR